MRTIKSFVLRGGRISPRQRQGLDQWLQTYLPPVSEKTWLFRDIFGREAPTIMEIGFGMGASLLEMAQNNPHINYLGVEVHQAGLGNLAADLHDLNIQNVRLVPLDAVQLLNTHIADETLDGLQIFFPDPWPKKRHHKRRLIQKEFVQLITTKLKPGGFLHCATDWLEYAEQMRDVLSQQPGLQNQFSGDGFALRPVSRPYTKFEQRGVGLGHSVRDLYYIKTMAASNF